jgi:hypothetical protein
MEPEPTITRWTPPAPSGSRDELDMSMAAVSDALTACGSDSAWIERVRGALGVLAAQLRLQAGSAQADGAHRGVLRAEPRLSKAVADQVREQDQLVAAIDDLLAYLAAREPTAGVTDVRDRARALMARLVRHRQGGSDLLYEVDEADLGGEG